MRKQFEDGWAEGSTRDSENIICPHCKARFSDSWELFDSVEGEFEATCHSCDATFLASRTASFTYYGCKQIEVQA